MLIHLWNRFVGLFWSVLDTMSLWLVLGYLWVSKWVSKAVSGIGRKLGWGWLGWMLMGALLSLFVANSEMTAERFTQVETITMPDGSSKILAITKTTWHMIPTEPMPTFDIFGDDK